MPDPGITRVAVYIDFDNIVISRYDQVHGRSQFQRDKVREFDRAEGSADTGIVDKLKRATVDIAAIIDFASSFGTLVLTVPMRTGRPINADYGDSSSAARWTWCSSSRPPPTPRTVPTSGWRWTRSRTCSACPT